MNKLYRKHAHKLRSKKDSCKTQRGRGITLPGWRGFQVINFALAKALHLHFGDHMHTLGTAHTSDYFSTTKQVSISAA